MMFDQDFRLLAGATLLGLLALPFVIIAIRKTRWYKRHKEDLAWNAKDDLDASPLVLPQPASLEPPKGPMDPATIQALLTQHATPAILMRRSWPIGADVPGASWLGGWPCLPTDWDWPRHGQTGLPLHFLAQVDCEDLPDLGGTSPLPRDGRMLFFADLDEERLWEGTVDTSRVIYVPKADEVDMPRSWPTDMPDIDHPEGATTGPDAQAGQRGFQPWPVTFATFTTWPAPENRRHGPIAHMDYRKAARARHTAEIAALLPAPPGPGDAVTDLLRTELQVDAEEQPILDDNGRRSIRHIFNPDPLGPAFPWCGAFLMNLLTHLRHRADRTITYHSDWLARAPDDDQRTRAQQGLAHGTAILQDIDALADAVGTAAPTAKLPGPFRPLLLTWIQDMIDSHGWQYRIIEAIRASAAEIARQAVTDPDMLALIDEHTIMLNLSMLQPAAGHCEHALLGHAQFKTNSTEGRGIRLLVLDSDGGVGFQFCDAGVTEYWIDPDDLAAGRFDGAYALTAGG